MDQDLTICSGSASAALTHSIKQDMLCRFMMSISIGLELKIKLLCTATVHTCQIHYIVSNFTITTTSKQVFLNNSGSPGANNKYVYFF